MTFLAGRNEEIILATIRDLITDIPIEKKPENFSLVDNKLIALKRSRNQKFCRQDLTIDS